MPVMDGLEATRHIRTFNADIPIVAVTASVDDSERNICISAGMNDVLMKPVVPAKLTAVVKAYTAKA